MAGLLEAHPGLARNYIRYSPDASDFSTGRSRVSLRAAPSADWPNICWSGRRTGAVVLDCSVTGLAGRLK